MSALICSLACFVFFCVAADAQDEVKALKGMRFSYSPAQGLDFEEGVTRRDPSDVIEVNGIYYVWYTKTKKGFSGYDATVWYATSKDGHAWTEQKEALSRGPKGAFDERSVFTPNILVAEGKYWLFYTAVVNPFDERTKTAIGLAVSNSPDGPFRRLEKNPVLETGESGTWVGPTPRTSAEPKGAWDSHRVDDACLIKRDRKYWLYYKGRQMGLSPAQTKMGLAVAERPEGPYVKHASNPIVTQGHEVLVWPCGNGVASLASRGPPSIWYSEDGIQFDLNQAVEERPMAPGAFRAEAFTETTPAENFYWGICMKNHKKWPHLARFEMHLPRVLIIGDSISIGYTPHVKKALAGVAEVHRNPGNAKHSGYGLEMLDQWLGDKKWEVIHFNHGLHDLKYVDDQGKNVSTEAEGHIQIPIEAYKKNLDTIVARLKKTKAHIIFATTTPYPDKVSAPLRKPGYAEKYNEAALQVMKKHNIEVNDLHGHVAPLLEKYQQPNNVHFKKEGSAFLGGEVAEAISKALY
jgi:lysophospholipase L1-like esterase/predicted GH43/DUF377 family glycosyl hydrolase